MTTTTVPIKRARIIQLFCPDTDTTVDRFTITPSETHEDVLSHVCAAFPGRLEEAWLHDVNGEPIFDVHTKVDGELILVAFEQHVRVRPEPGLEVALFLEDDNAPKPLKNMYRVGRREYIRILRRSEARQQKIILRLTLPHAEVASALETLKSPTAAQKAQRFSSKCSKASSKENWDAKTRFPGDYKCLAALATLSNATCGQPHVVSEALYYQWKSRMGRIGDTAPAQMNLRHEDVVAVINALYEEADAVGSTWPDSSFVKKKWRRQKAKAEEFEGVRKRMRDDDENELGVEHLVVKVKVAQAPDESDEDEDEEYRVRVPGRHW